MSKSDPAQYTKPELRDKIKKSVTEGDKGGKPGQWSARKAQLVTQEYEKEGGGYKKEKTDAQKSLEQWGDEKWTTSDGEKAERADGTTRYLPKKAWKELDSKQKADTNEKKKEGSRAGKQFVSNTPAAAKARKRSVQSKSTAGAAGRKRTSPAGKSAASGQKTAARKEPAAAAKEASRSKKSAAADDKQA
jgi:hypothetical protein